MRSRLISQGEDLYSSFNEADRNICVSFKRSTSGSFSHILNGSKPLSFESCPVRGTWRVVRLGNAVLEQKSGVTNHQVWFSHAQTLRTIPKVF